MSGRNLSRMFKRSLWAITSAALLLIAVIWIGGENSNTNAASDPAPLLAPVPASNRAPLENVDASIHGAPLSQAIIEDCGTVDPGQSLEFTSDPYPRSSLFTLEWADPGTMRCAARGSDNFIMTWTANDTLFSSFGDGNGLNVSSRPKMSLAFLELTGSATDFDGRNIFGPNIEVFAEDNAQGRNGLKAAGMLSVDGVLYIWLRNVNSDGRQCQVASSADDGITWQKAPWVFNEFGFCGFVNYGQDYAMPPHVAEKHGDYVYMYSNDDDTYGDTYNDGTPKGPSAYTPSNGFYFTRVPKDRILERDAYEFFIEVDGANNPTWSSDINDILGQQNSDLRIFIQIGKASRSNMIYNAALDRYFWWQGYRNHVDSSDARYTGGFGIYDAPEPWGPWTTIYNVERWDWGPGDMGTFPTKWISEDGLTMYLAFSGNDRLSVRRADLTWLVTPTSTPTPTNVNTPTPTPTVPTATPTRVPPTPTNTLSPEETLTPRPSPTSTPTPLIDSDGDGIFDLFEGFITGSTPTQNTDGDELLDYLDPDDDNDGIFTRDENPDPNGDGNPEDAQNTDGDDWPDYLDPDDDNDGLDTIFEGTGDYNANGIADHIDVKMARLLYLPLVSELEAEPTPTPLPVTRTFRITNGDQDAEESCSGVVRRGIDNESDSIDLGRFQNEVCYAAFHYTSIRIPQGADISEAYLIFESNDNMGLSANFIVFAHDADSAQPINSANNFDISSRERTSATIGWNGVQHWSKNQSYSSPNLAPIIQELVNRPGWDQGNDILMVVTGEGRRQAESFNGDDDGAARLVVTFQ